MAVNDQVLFDQIEQDKNRFNELVNGDENATVELEDRTAKSIAGQVRDRVDEEIPEAVGEAPVSSQSGTDTLRNTLDRRGIMFQALKVPTSGTFDAEDFLETSTQIQEGAYCYTLGYYTPGDGGGNDYEIVAAATGTDDGGSFIDLSGSGLQARGLSFEKVNIRQFGAKGDGASDDTSAYLNAVSSGYKHVVIPFGTFLVTQTAVSSVNGRVITCDGWLTTDVSPLTFLEVRGDDSYIQINVDGASLGTKGVEIIDASNCIVEKGNYKGLVQEPLTMSGAIRYTGVGAIKILRNNIFGSHLPSDNTGTTDSNTVTRAIYLYRNGEPVAPAIVSDNYISGSTGETESSIQVLCEREVSGLFKPARVTIENNTIAGFNRRGIKCQGSKVVIRNNLMRSDLAAAEISLPGAGVDLQFCYGVSVVDNEIYCKGMKALTLSGDEAFSYAKENKIQGNTLESGYDSDCVVLFKAERIRFVDNKITGGDRSLVCGFLSDSYLSMIEFDGSQTRSIALNMNNSQRNIIREVFNHEGSTGITVNVDGVGNSDNYVSGVYALHSDNIAVKYGTNNVNGVVRDVVSFRFAPVSGDRSTTKVANVTNMALNAASEFSQVADVYFTSTSPDTATPSLTYSRGDVSFNLVPNPGGVAGWVCTTSGTPGTWKAMAALSA